MKRLSFFLAFLLLCSPAFAMKYSITSQADIENLPTLTANDTVKLVNDIALNSDWVPIPIWSLATLDGNGHKITNLTTQSGGYYATPSKGAVLTSNFTLGKTWSISWWQKGYSTAGSAYYFGNVSNRIATFGDNKIHVSYSGAGAAGISTGIAQNTWGWCVLVRNGAAATQLYVNGVLKGTTSPINNDFSPPKYLMCNGATSTSPMTIPIDEFAIWEGVALTQAQISKLYGNGSVRQMSATMTIAPAPTYLYHFDNTGTTCTDSISANNGTWETAPTYTAQVEVKGGFIDTMTSGTIQDLTIESPSISWGITDTSSSALSLGGIVSTMSNSSMFRCVVTGGTISAPGVKYINMGGLIGAAQGTTVKNCYTSLDSMSSITDCRSGGLIGLVYGGGTYENNYTVGGATNAPKYGLVGHIVDGGTIRNNWSAMVATVKELFATPDTSGTFTNNYFYDRGLGETRGTAVATLTDFYNITQAPMTSWDFTPTGSWSKSKDGTDYPVFNAYFSGDISGTVTGWTSGKTVKLVTKSNSVAPYYNKAVGTLSSAINLGSTFTVAFIVGDTPAQGTIWGLLYKDVQNFITYDGSVSNCSLRMRVASADIATEINQNVDLRGRHRVVFVKTAGAASKIYYDGRLLTMNAYSNPINSNSFNGLAYLLRQYSGQSPSGVISEVVMFNDAKDQAWVTADYGNGEIKKYTSGDTGIVEGFHLDEGTGSVCTSFVTARTVTISPAPIWTDNVGYTIYNTTTATTTGSGDFSFSSVAGDHGLPALIYIDDASVQGSIAATLPDGLTAPITGIALRQNTVQIGDAKLHNAMTPTLLNSASIYGLTDNNYRIASNVLYYNNGVDAMIPTGCTYSGVILPDTAETGDILVDGTATLSGTVNGLTNTGTLTFTTGTVNGDITNSGTFTANTVQIQVYSPTITNSGTMTLRAVFKDDTAFLGNMTLTSPNFSVAGKTYTFEHGKTYSYDTLTINGTLGSEISILSDSAGSRFTLDGAGATLNFVDVKDCQASTADIDCKRCINSRGNDDKEATPHLSFWDYHKAFVMEYN